MRLILFSIYLSIGSLFFQGSLQAVEKESQMGESSPLYYIAEAPLSMQQLWQEAHVHFLHRKNIKTHDSRWFAKWHQLYKLCGNNKNEAGHYERKESIVVNANTPGSPPLESCKNDLHHFCIDHLSKLEKQYQIPPHTLTMERAVKPMHTLRLLHYFSDARATAHYDTSIMTCLYYQEGGLELKVDGKWIEAPKLKPNQMLVSYGVPGEILSNGNVRAIRHRVRCNERYAVVYFHNTPKEYALSSQKYHPTTMAHVYQEAQLWYADVNARAVRKVCSSTELPWYAVLYGWLAQRWASVNESHISQKEEPECNL